MALVGDKARIIEGLSKEDRRIFGDELDKLWALAAAFLAGNISHDEPYFRLAGETNDAPSWNNADYRQYSDAGGTIVNHIRPDGDTVFNEQGSDQDFRIEGWDEGTASPRPYLFHVDAGANEVRFGTDNTGDGTNATFRKTAIVFNEDQTDQDFRVEGNGEQWMLFVDAGLGRVQIGGSAAPEGKLHVTNTIPNTMPVLCLEQPNVDEDYLKIIGTSDTSVDRALVDAANFTTPGAIVGWLKILVNDDQVTDPITDGDYYIPFYAAPSA